MRVTTDNVSRRIGCAANGVVMRAKDDADSVAGVRQWQIAGCIGADVVARDHDRGRVRVANDDPVIVTAADDVALLVVRNTVGVRANPRPRLRDLNAVVVTDGGGAGDIQPDIISGDRI